MSRTQPDLDAKLTKKWLSSNAAREALLTSLILTLRNAGATGDVEGRVDRSAQATFKRLQADEEYAPPAVLRDALTAIERELEIDRVPPDLLARHRDVCERLFAKVDRQSGYQ